MISFTSKPILIPQPRYTRWKLDTAGEFVEELPPDTIRMRSWSKSFLLSPDLEAYARRESDEIDPKYGLGWVFLAKIARKMHDTGTLEPRYKLSTPRPAEDLFARVHRQVRQEYNPRRPSFWHRLLIRLGLMGH